jgi:hypothetical protein
MVGQKKTRHTKLCGSGANHRSKAMVTKSEYKTQELVLLRELAIDGNWEAARKRGGLSVYQARTLREDPKFMKKAESLMGDQASKEMKEAIKKFEKTQNKLIEELDAGNLDVAGTLMRSHEIEFKRFGLFEKDNKQKGSSVSINISFADQPDKMQLEEGVIDG